jgi:L-cystine uptake protein TcyP (sodium:dicarboxylate symporter family)
MGPANDGLRFLLELGTLASVAYWGWEVGDGWSRWLLVLAMPVVVAAVWGRFMAPKSAARVGDPWRFVLEVLIFGAAVAALAGTGHAVLAATFAALVALHLGLTFALGQRRIE